MPETPDEYRLRLASYVDNRDPLEIQRETPAKLARLLDAIPADRLTRRANPQQWSIVEILAHLAEDELTSTWRYRQMIEHPGAALPGFDQNLWARLGHYSAWEPREALEMFRLLREANLRMLASLSEAEWDRSGLHAERGPISVRSLARHMAAHDVNHVLQIEKLLAGN